MLESNWFIIRGVIIILLGVILLGFSGCGKPQKLNVKDAILVLSPVDSNPSALYFTVYGGQKDVKLRSILSTSVIRTEIHRSSKDEKTGVMAMAKQDAVDIPAQSQVEFKRGGYHGMIWGVNLIARRTAEIEVQFVFSNGDRIQVKADVQELDGSLPDERKALGVD